MACHPPKPDRHREAVGAFRGGQGRRPSRTPGAYVVLRDGEPMLFVERGGRGILRLRYLDDSTLAEAIGELARAAREGLLPRLAIERLDGEPVIGSGLEETLIEAGFSRQPRRLVASASTVAAFSCTYIETLFWE